MEPLSILVIDDEEDVAFLFRQYFRQKIREGIYQFQFAGNGRQALDILTPDSLPDLILTDLNMPEMDGISFLQEINTRPWFNQLRAIVVSAYGDMTKIRAAMNSGAFDFITKPIDFQDLEKTILKAKEEIKQLKENLHLKVKLIQTEEEREKAIQSEKFKQQFLANMSHEIRTPMNAILGMTRLALNTPLDAVQEKYLKGIHQSAGNLLVIINDILDFSKIEAGKLEFESIPFQIREVIHQVLDILKFKAEEKGLLLNQDVGADVPEWVNGDPVRLHQILLNLAGNSIKFTNSGHVAIRCHPSGAAFRFEVSDTGIGIPLEKQAHIFESFSQAQSDTTRNYGGTGLGLTITKELTELQGGQIGLYSEPGKGSTFWIEIPYVKTSAPPLPVHAENHENDLDGIRILLVEDNPFNQIVATDTLEEFIKNVTIEVAEHGQEALEKLQAQKHFDVILMDVQMPVMDGFEATKAIRNSPPPISSIPIIALTANAVKEEVQRCKDCGMDDFVTKPFDPKELLKKIQQLIHR